MGRTARNGPLTSQMAHSAGPTNYTRQMRTFAEGPPGRRVVNSCRLRQHGLFQYASVAAPLTRGEIAATPMTGWGPSGERYLRLVFANEPIERLGDLRTRFDAALA